MPSNKSTRKQVVIDKNLLEAVRKKASRFNLTDTRDAAFVGAALQEWLEESFTPKANPPISTSSTQPSNSKNPDVVSAQNNLTSSGHDQRVQWVLQHLIDRSKNDVVGPIGAKAIAKDIKPPIPGVTLSSTFIAKALKELVKRGYLKYELERSGPVGSIYIIMKK